MTILVPFSFHLLGMLIVYIVVSEPVAELVTRAERELPTYVMRGLLESSPGLRQIVPYDQAFTCYIIDNGSPKVMSPFSLKSLSY